MPNQVWVGLDWNRVWTHHRVQMWLQQGGLLHRLGFCVWYFKAGGHAGDGQHNKLPQVGESCSEAKTVGYNEYDTL